MVADYASDLACGTMGEGSAGLVGSLKVIISLLYPLIKLQYAYHAKSDSLL